MNARRFDRLTKDLTGRVSRRAVLRTGSAGLAVGALAGSVAAQDATPAASGAKIATPTPGSPIHPHAGLKTEFLFTQTFDAGTWRPKPGAKDIYTLTLTGAAAETAYFSDRPERVVGLSSTDKFLAGLGFTPANPPNAALVAEPVGGGDQDILVIELTNPTYDAKAASLSYDAKVLADYEGYGIASLAKQQQDDDFAESFGRGGLFIDDCSDTSDTCYRVINGQKQTVGEIDSIGRCYNPVEIMCQPCDCDGTDGYYGNLCALRFAECHYYSDGVDGWDCFVHDIQCGDPDSNSSF